MSSFSNPKKVMIPCRFSFLHCWEPDSVNGSEPKYSVSAIIPKSDTKTVSAIKAAIEVAKQESLPKWGGKIPPNLKLPLRDGDIDRPEDEAYAGCYFLNANSREKPQVVDKQVQPILDQTEVYSGCYGRITVTFYGYNSNGNRGVAAGLGNIQKLKDGDEVLFTCESTNSVELLFFTNHRQVYKSHAYDFNDSKASVLGDYVASALGMEEGEVPLYMVVTPDYKGWMLFFYDNGKCAKVPLSSYETKQNRRKLLKAYSDKAELAFMRHLPEETELAIFTTNNRLLLVGSALIPEKTTRDTAGVSVVALKKNAKIARVTLAEGLELNDAPRYRVRTLPAAGAILKDDDRAEQLTL